MRIRKGLRDTELQRESRERDACAVVAVIEKDGLPRRSSIGRALAALQRMEHRSGFVRGEGDGCGLLLDLPRRFWHQRLAQYLPAQEARLAYSPRFAVGHLFAPRDAAGGAWEEAVRSLFRAAGFRVLWQGRGDVVSEALGPLGRAAEPLFWQVTVVDEKEVPPRGNPSQQRWQREARLFELRLRLEQQPGVHVASLSTWTVVYKALGSAATLPAYYGDLAAPSLASAACIGHNRYSTNTTPSFGRVQPFTLLGHNGEINTDRRLRQETEMLGIPVNPQGSDSQDLNRALEGLIYRLGLTPLEAMEAMFSPILDEIRQYPADWQDAYAYLRSAWGPFAQGPAAVVFRCGHTCVFSVDALGLRPLWQLETGQEYVFSSEQGVVPLAEMVAEPRPLGPGEKVAVQLPERPGDADSDSAALSAPDGGARLLAYEDLQEEVVRRVRRRWPVQGFREDLSGPAPGREWEELVEPAPGPKPESPPAWQLYAFGWQREDQQFVQHMAQTGAEPIRSMGCDLPLAALAPEGANLADYFKESVAVVTNPAIDREREMEHFSTWVQLGPRPSLSETGPHGVQEARARLSLPAPVLAALPGGREVLPERATGVAPPSPGLPPLPARWRALRPAWLSLTRPASEPLQVAVARLQQEAAALARAGSGVLVLTDHGAWQCPDSGERLLGIDPHLALAAVDQALRQAPGHTGNDAADDAGDGAAAHAADDAGDDAGGDAAGDAKGGRGNLRRRTSLVLSSGALRNLHDIVLALGLGADAVHPFLMLQIAAAQDGADGQKRLLAALRKGVEKVTSTLGIHELAGYSRLFAALGLKPEVGRMFEVPLLFGSPHAGTGWRELEEEAARRAAVLARAQPATPFALPHPVGSNVHAWKAVARVAAGEADWRELAEFFRQREQASPLALRHVLDVRRRDAGTPPQAHPSPDAVDTSVGGHRLPFVISSMSFGSQSETAFRAYAEAARRLDIVAMNGEGGEIRDLMGRYWKNRGIQVASGRFGITAEVCNAGSILEIKIGQGAKPGEGGHLPGAKVSEKVAQARHARPGTDLISPSNNHDIYSIEDLAQIIYELKQVNPRAKVAVKVPVVPGIGTIAVGIAKAGADILTLSGFEGGTGAARAHAIRHVGLPVEFGVRQAHCALLAAGLRHSVEIWGDGGLRSGRDAVRLMMLGADRVGFGTMALFAIGCTACRQCHKGTCHVGICTQIESPTQAAALGVRHFVPRDLETAVTGLCRVFEALAAEVREITAGLGFTATRQLVGRSDLLVQVAARERLDASELLEPAPAAMPLHPSGAVPAGAPGRRSAPRPVPVPGRRPAGAARAAFTWLSGRLARKRGSGKAKARDREVVLPRGFIAGNGFAAFHVPGLTIRLEGGAQDGAAKSSLGGKVVILKAPGADGRRLDGSVGKSFAYGAVGGTFLVQGNADSRFAIRLSGARVLLGGMPSHPVSRSSAGWAATANARGFAFEYMTAGTAVVLGDPGPWICAGMTGGVVYLRYWPEMGLDEEALRRRLARGAPVELLELEAQDVRELRALLAEYEAELRRSGQLEEADCVRLLAAAPRRHFRCVRPRVVRAARGTAGGQAAAAGQGAAGAAGAGPWRSGSGHGEFDLGEEGAD